MKKKLIFAFSIVTFNIFQILSDTESFPNAKEIFEMNNGLEMIYTLRDTTNSDDLKEHIDIFLLRNFPPQ